jgi:GT2 family glycosyltransferase
MKSSTGVVVIGRNEGDRLRRCLESGVVHGARLVYVDSGSADDSVNLAKKWGAEIVELDPSTPFTAARARNEGFDRLHEIDPKLTFVQFVDGDCELRMDWLANAEKFLSDHADVAAVAGRLREKYPANSIYNTLCDIEWDKPIGNVKACGGIAMFRISAYSQVHGFRIDLIAGEEPELCVRLRAVGWRVWRLGEEMALHDSAMFRFGQWWKRMQRGGYAFAQGAHLHGAAPERHGVRESRSTLVWGLGLPLFALASIALLGPVGLAIFAVYPLQVARLAARGTRTARENWLHAVFLVLGKFPETVGQLQFFARRRLGRRSRLIEYK